MEGSYAGPSDHGSRRRSVRGSRLRPRGVATDQLTDYYQPCLLPRLLFPNQSSLPGEVMLFSDVIDLSGRGRCADSIVSCEQKGILGAIHPALLAKAHARMLQERCTLGSAGA